MATFPVGFASYEANVHNAKLLATIARESGGDVAEERARHAPTAADSWTLRGIPALGRGVASVIRSTDPVGALLAKETRGPKHDLQSSPACLASETRKARP